MGANLTKSENGIIQIAIFWNHEIPFKITVLQGKCHIIILLRLSSISFALKCEGCTRTFSVSFARLFFGIFAVARFSSEGFLQQSRKHGWVPLYFTFSLILPSSASSQMQFQVCISSNKTIEVFSECFNFSKNNFWWYYLKRLELTNFWHNMPSAAAKIFRRNFSTKIEVADKKFCTSYIT